LNHRKKIKAELIRLIPRKLTANLKLLTVDFSKCFILQKSFFCHCQDVAGLVAALDKVYDRRKSDCFWTRS